MDAALTPADLGYNYTSPTGVAEDYDNFTFTSGPLAGKNICAGTSAPDPSPPPSPTQNPQTITFTSTNPSPVTPGYSTAPPTYTPTATATSGLDVIFSIDSSSTSGTCSISNGVVSFNTIGMCIIDADQPGDAYWSAASQAHQSITVGESFSLPSPQTILFTSHNPTPVTVSDSAYTPTATATSGLDATITIDNASASVCSISNGAVSFNGVGTCVVDANQPGDGYWQAAPQVQQSIVVDNGPGTASPPGSPANQTVTFLTANPSPVAVGVSTYAPVAIAFLSGLTVTLSIDSSSTSSVCSISSGAVSFNEVGTCIVDANQPGNGYWNAAPQAQQSITIDPSGLPVASAPPTPNPPPTTPSTTVTDGSSWLPSVGGECNVAYDVPTGASRAEDGDLNFLPTIGIGVLDLPSLSFAEVGCSFMEPVGSSFGAVAPELPFQDLGIPTVTSIESLSTPDHWWQPPASPSNGSGTGCVTDSSSDPADVMVWSNQSAGGQCMSEAAFDALGQSYPSHWTAAAKVVNVTVGPPEAASQDGNSTWQDGEWGSGELWESVTDVTVWELNFNGPWSVTAPSTSWETPITYDACWLPLYYSDSQQPSWPVGPGNFCYPSAYVPGTYEPPLWTGLGPWIDPSTADGWATGGGGTGPVVAELVVYNGEINSCGWGTLPNCTYDYNTTAYPGQTNCFVNGDCGRVEQHLRDSAVRGVHWWYPTQHHTAQHRSSHYNSSHHNPTPHNSSHHNPTPHHTTQHHAHLDQGRR